MCCSVGPLWLDMDNTAAFCVLLMGPDHPRKHYNNSTLSRCMHMMQGSHHPECTMHHVIVSPARRMYPRDILRFSRHYVNLSTFSQQLKKSLSDCFNRLIWVSRETLIRNPWVRRAPKHCCSFSFYFNILGDANSNEHNICLVSFLLYGDLLQSYRYILYTCTFMTSVLFHFYCMEIYCRATDIYYT